MGGRIGLGRWGVELPPAAPRWADDLETAAQAALIGGAAACAYYESDDLEVREKAGPGQDIGGSPDVGPGQVTDPVTRADHASNDAILELLATRSGEPVLSEESPAPADRSGRLWVVDPLDGTKEFISRNGEFSVMVGLAVGGEARLGAVYEPAAARLYLGIAGGAAWTVAHPERDARASPLRIDGSPGQPLRLIRSRSHPDAALARLEERLEERPGGVRIVLSGSVGIKCASVARGGADLYVHPVPYLKEWDTCAPEAVLRGAGGRVTDCRGMALRYGKRDPVQPGGIFCAHPDVYDDVAPLVREIGRHLFET
ncbi:MAG: 3'(2'),5'-bisphosphate nucleotidase CysQ [Gemmatimonadota bacterium]